MGYGIWVCSHGLRCLGLQCVLVVGLQCVMVGVADLDLGFSDLICEPRGGRELWIWVFLYLICELYGGLSAMSLWLPV